MPTLSVSVVGGGLAGLCSAISLRRAGHQVTIYEKSQFKREIGAAITLTPNANRVLEHWRLDLRTLGETDKLQSRRVNPETLACEARVDLSGVPRTFGANFNAFHRVDLHKGLREMAEQLGIKIHLGQEIVGLDCETATITTATGDVVQTDLVILGDGINCKFLEALNGSPVPNSISSKSVYRTLIPMSRLMSNPRIASLFKGEPSGFLNSFNPETGVMLITYPCRSDTILNIVLFHNTRPKYADADHWNHPSTIEDAVHEMQKGNTHPVWSELMECADEMKVYRLSSRQPLETMVRGKCVIIGDAAHPMMATYAQAGCMAIEDAAALEVLFANPKGPVEDTLKLFNAMRLPRNAVTQIMSNAMFYHTALDAQQAIKKFYTGNLLPAQIEPWTEPIQRFFYAYNVFEQAEKIKTYWEREGKVPPRELLEEDMFGLHSE
ncbi:MAG: hypothetical protein M1820_008659 [Bogoriella megaspora]|nr:MAG: hypothetical protein M1820_008659 [Bogoriella megaspora]